MLTPDSRYWDYPVLTPVVVEDCKQLGIYIDKKILRFYGTEQLHAFLKSVERPLTRLMERRSGVQKETLVGSAFDASLYTTHQVKQLSTLFLPLQKASLSGLSLYVHGSMADQSYNSFSDVDDLVVLRSEAWQDFDTFAEIGTRLTRIARLYQDVDPLQHHGHWLVTEFDLLSYDPSYIPPVALQDAKRVVGQDLLEFCVHNNPRGFSDNTSATIRSIRRSLKQASEQKGLNAFQLKGLVGEIAITPAYLCQLHGQMIPKPAAIKEAKQMYSPLGYRAVEWATMVRHKFDRCIDNLQMCALKKLARFCGQRRQQTERLFKKFATWVSNDHELGLNAEVRESITTFAQESQSLNSQEVTACQ